jgi:hypothetical protein
VEIVGSSPTSPTIKNKYIVMINIQEKLEDDTLLFGWKSDPPLTPFAPSYSHLFIEKKIFSEEECDEWNEYLLKQEQIILDKFKTALHDSSTGLGEQSVTSRSPFFNVLEFDFHLAEQLKTKVFDCICYLLDITNNTTWQETLYTTCWFNVLRQEEKMNMHTHAYHGNTFYGFHVTIKAIAPSFTSYYHPIKHQEEAFHVPNKRGYLTLFPNLIPHSVTPNKYETPRISIAGDIYASTIFPFPSGFQNTLVNIGTCNNPK